MSATISKPVTGQHKSAAPFGTVALLAGVVALGAIGIAVGQNIGTVATAGKAVPTVDYPDQIAARVGTVAPVSDYPDQIAARLGTVAPVSDYPDQIAARLGTSPSLSMIMTESLLADRYGNASYLQRIATEGLLADRYGSTNSSNLNPGEIMLQNLGREGGLTGLSAGPQTGHQKGLDAPKVAHAGPAKHPVAN